MMKNSKEKNKNYNVMVGLASAKAITLITLVITIVILILLASVTINLALKDNGLFSRTKEAKNQFDSVSFKEDVEKAILTSKMNENVTIDTTVLENELRNTYNITDITKSENGALPWTVKKNGYEYVIEGETTEEESQEIIWEDLVIGTAINTDKYGYKVDGYHVTETNDDVWRLFYQDSEYTYIISDELVGSYKPSDYYTTVTKGEDDSTLKYQSGADVSTIGQKLSPIISSLFTTAKTNYNILTTAWLTDTTQWEQYKTNDAEYAIGSPTVELFVASYNSTNQGYTILLDKGTYGYTENTSSGWLSTSANHGIYNKSSSSDWWLASPYDSSKRSELYVDGYYGYFGNYDVVGNSRAVRPIVCFQTSVFNKNYTSLINE